MSRATASSAIARAQRQARVTEGLQAITASLRNLAATDTPPAEARQIARRYLRAVGVSQSAASPAGIAFLSGPAASLPIEDVDDALRGFAAAADAIRKARGS